ncbi:MAG: hypothetical protein H7Z17_19330 [Fuerstia sp.]|nr:hypothetical protein [Fuerstiella sp.]
MLQWPVDESTADNSSSRFVPKPGHGRAVQPLAVKSWQVPQHPGPLTVAQAMVFSEALKPDMLNDAQWDAIGKWMCLGGTVFVSEKSAEVIDRLKKATPLAMEPAVNFEQFSVHRCGSGSVREYSGPLFSADDTKAPRLIAEAAARLSRYNVMTMLDETKLSWWQSENAAWTKMLVVIVFGVYTLLSGVVTLLLFRLDRRRIAIYTGIVVLTACVASLVLGGVLRNSAGDLRWVTVTQASPGGLVQVAKIDVQSAGGRNTQVTVRGKDVDLQLIESETVNSSRYYYYQTIESNRAGYPAFSLQPNLLSEEPDACQINVPITPWGYRQTWAAAFDPAARGLEVKLTYQSSDASSLVDASMHLQSLAHLGKFTLTATNHLPFDLKNCQLVVSSTGVNLSETAATPSYDPRTGNYRLREGSAIGDLTHVESTAAIGDLIPSQTVTHPAVNMVATTRNDRGIYYSGSQPGSESLPRIAANGATSAWIVGRISRSPILSIDELRSDFKAFEEMHIFVQEILPEDMPDEWLKFQQLRLEKLVESAAKMKSQNAPVLLQQ